MGDERDLIKIGPDGSVHLGPELARRLASRAGSFRLLPTGGDLVLLQRVRDGHGAATEKRGRALLAGEIDRMGGLADIIQFISTNAWSGQLEIVSGATRKALYCRRGDIQSAASNVPDDRLGAILYRFGLVREEVLEAAIKRAAGSPNRIGALLVEEGAISAHDLYTSMRRQVEEIFYSVLTIRSGEFYFYKTAEDDGPPSQLLLATKGLLFEGVRRIDELSYFHEKLPSGDMVLVRREPAPEEKLKPLEERVLKLVDGLRSIHDIARESQLGEFEGTRTLFQLLQSGWVQPRPASKARPADHESDDVHETVLAVFNAVYAKVHAAVAQQGKSEALERGVDSFFASVAEFSPLFVGVMLLPDGTLPIEQLLFNLSMSPVADKLDYLNRGLNELLFFELFTAGEAVDRTAEIELHQRLSQIMKASASQGVRSASSTSIAIPVES